MTRSLWRMYNGSCPGSSGILVVSLSPGGQSQRPLLEAETSNSDDSMEANHSSVLYRIVVMLFLRRENRTCGLWVSLPRRVLYALALVEAADRFRLHEANAGSDGYRGGIGQQPR